MIVDADETAPADGETVVPRHARNGDVLLVQTSIGDYRQAVLEELQLAWGPDFHILCGREYFSPSLKTGVRLPSGMKFVKNRFFLRRRALYQPGVIGPALRAAGLILEFNPRILNTWLVLLGRRMTGRKTVVWGHAWSRRGEDNRLRRWMRWLSDVVLVYTEQQRLALAPHVPGHVRVIAAPNALYRRDEMAVAGDADSRRHFLFVGRLVREKKPALLVEAFRRALPNLAPSTELLLVGDGPERAALAQQIETGGLSGRVRMLGHIADLEQLRSLYESSIAAVSPGYVGLSITQSFSFGVPMIISRDEPHAPEIEAAIEGENCEFFETDSADALAATLLEFVANRQTWADRAASIVELCRANYSVELMAERIQEAIAHVRPVPISAAKSGSQRPA